MKNNYYPKTFGRKRGRKRNFSILDYKSFLKDYLVNNKIYKKKLLLKQALVTEKM